MLYHLLLITLSTCLNRVPVNTFYGDKPTFDLSSKTPFMTALTFNTPLNTYQCFFSLHLYIFPFIIYGQNNFILLNCTHFKHHPERIYYSHDAPAML